MHVERRARAEPAFGTMGRKLDPTKKAKRGPGRKARKQKGAETELLRFLPAADDENSKRLSSRARKRAAKRRLSSAETPKTNKPPGAKSLPGKLPKGVSAGAVQTPAKKGAPLHLTLLGARSGQLQPTAAMRKRRRKSLKRMVWRTSGASGTQRTVMLMS